MSFLYPIALWLSAALPAVVLLYLRRQKRRTQTVSTLLFWQRAMAAQPHQRFLGKLRQPWSLLLQLLILALLILAAAQLRIGGTFEPRSTVVVIDSRARMQAGDAFSKAREAALAIAGGAGPGEEVAIIGAEASPAIVSPFSRDPKHLREVLNKLAPSDGGGDFSQSVRLAQNLLRSRPGKTRLMTISDRVDPALKDAEQIAVGKSGGNLAIIASSARPVPSSPQTWEIFTRVANFSDKAETAEVSLSLDGKLFDARRLPLEAGATGAFIAALPLRDTGKGLVETVLKSSDAMKLDDRAYAALPVGGKTQVLLITKGNPFLESALKANPAINLEVLSPEIWKPSMASAFAVVAFDGQPPADVPMDSETGFLFFGGSPAGAAEKVAQSGAVEIADPKSPLLRNADLSSAVFPTGLRLPAITGDNWRVDDVVKGPSGPLITTLERPGGGPRRAIFSFGVADSDLPLKAAFPIFLSNTVQWLAGNEKDASRDMAAGSVLKTEESLVAAQTDSSRTLRKAGFYEVKDKDSTRWVAVNIFAPEESDVRQANASGGVKATFLPASLLLWQWLALAAFALLLAEWRLHHRRVTE